MDKILIIAILVFVTVWFLGGIHDIKECDKKGGTLVQNTCLKKDAVLE